MSKKKAKKIIETIVEAGAVTYTCLMLFMWGLLDIFLAVTYHGYLQVGSGVVLIYMFLKYKVMDIRRMLSEDE